MGSLRQMLALHCGGVRILARPTAAWHLHPHPSFGAFSQSTSALGERNSASVSQEELADRAQVHRTFIGAVERSETNVSIDNIARTSDALGVSAFELLRV